MSHLSYQFTVVISRDDSLVPEPAWVSWTPEFNVVSQGDSPGHSLYMLCEALRGVAELDVRAHRYEATTDDYVLERVIHPLRRLGGIGDGLHSIPEWGGLFAASVDHRNSAGAWATKAHVSLSSRAAREAPYLVVTHCMLYVECLYGMLQVHTSAAPWADVPAERVYVSLSFPTVERSWIDKGHTERHFYDLPLVGKDRTELLDELREQAGFDWGPDAKPVIRVITAAEFEERQVGDDDGDYWEPSDE